MNKIYIINAPVLFESGFYSHMDANIVVSANHDQILHRGKLRDDLTYEEIESRLAHQISLNEKISRADYVIDNSGSIENTRQQVEIIWNNLLRKMGVL